MSNETPPAAGPDLNDPNVAPAPRKPKPGSGLVHSIGEVLSGIRSPDSQTRNGALLFLFSVVGVFFVAGLGGYYYIEGRKIHSVGSGDSKDSSEDTGKNLGDFIK